MLLLSNISSPLQPSAKRLVLCCGLIGLSLSVILVFGLLPRTRAAERLLPNHQELATPKATPPGMMASYARLALSFEANQGQFDSRVRFRARGSGYSIFLTDEGAVLTLNKRRAVASGRSSNGTTQKIGDGDRASVAKSHPRMNDDQPATDRSVVQMSLVGASASAAAIGMDELPGKTNYFIGYDPAKWRTNIPTFGRVKFTRVYPGVDLVYYGNQRQLEYDFVVAPGADAGQIKLSFAGADHC